MISQRVQTYPAFCFLGFFQLVLKIKKLRLSIEQQVIDSEEPHLFWLLATSILFKNSSKIAKSS